MKLKTLTFLLLIFFLKTASAQTDTFKILLGEDDLAITQYYKRLMNLFPDNSYLQIVKDLDEDGNKILKLELPTDRDGKVGFVMTFSRFVRLEDTIEICKQQFFVCDNSSAVEYLSYIKDNYKSAGLNKWTKEFNETFDIMAEFKRGEGSVSTISLYLKGKTK